MKLFKNIVAGALAFCSSVSMVSADATANANAGALAGAESSSTIDAGNSLGLSNSVGAALCSNSVGTPILSISRSDDACEIMQGAMAMVDRGLLTRAEAREYGLRALEMSGAILVTESSPPLANLATSISAMNQRTGVLLSVQGEWVELSVAQQQAVVACEMLWNGNKIEGCEYPSS